jgi:hypothetical protein
MNGVGVKSDSQIVADVAGAVGGGAARLLRELKKYLPDSDRNISLIGEGRRLTPGWLAQRELIAPRAELHLSLNNAGFITPFGSNITLLRNVLHFATNADLDRIGFRPSRELRLQTPLVRLLARQSEALVVPCTKMGEQVADVAPYLADRLTVRFHPVAKPTWAGEQPENSRDVLVPIVPQPYKNLDQHLPEFLAASEKIAGGPVRLIVPAKPETLPDLASHPRVKFIGQQTSEALDSWWRRCGAIFFPVEFESFGYALAESRVYGRSIIAQDTKQNREIAGAAIRPYRRQDAGSLHSAIEEAVNSVPTPDPDPFDPTAYFNWLFAGPIPDTSLAASISRRTTS